MRRYWVPVIAVLLILAGVVTHFFTAPERVLEAVRVVEEGGYAVVEVDFTVPVRQEGVLPEQGPSALVQIKLRTVALAGDDRNEYLGRGALSGVSRRVPLTDVAYEAQVPGGPLLTLRFERPVHFRLDPADGRNRLRFIVEDPGLAEG